MAQLAVPAARCDVVFVARLAEVGDVDGVVSAALLSLHAGMLRRGERGGKWQFVVAKRTRPSA